MTLTPLFTQGDLEKAFSSVLPAARARLAAADWFRAHDEQLSPDGYFLLDAELVVRPSASPEADSTDHGPSIEDAAASEAAFWRALSDEERLEWLTPRFSGIHCDLVAQLSEVHAERIRRALGDSREQASRRHQIVRRVLDLLGSRDAA